MIGQQRLTSSVPSATIRQAVIKRVIGGVIYVQEYGGASLQALPPTGINTDAMNPGDTVLVYNDGNVLRVLGYYAGPTSGGTDESVTRTTVTTSDYGCH